MNVLIIGGFHSIGKILESVEVWVMLIKALIFRYIQILL